MVDEALFMQETQAQFTRLYKVAYSILHARADAEDAVQEALTKAWSARTRARAETFGPWLMRIVVNECRNVQRHRMRVVPVEAPAPPAPFEPPDPDLYNAVRDLPEGLRIPFTLKYIAQYTEKEIAQIMHLPVSTVKNRLAKARKVLRAALSDWEVSFQ